MRSPASSPKQSQPKLKARFSWFKPTDSDENPSVGPSFVNRQKKSFQPAVPHDDKRPQEHYQYGQLDLARSDVAHSPPQCPTSIRTDKAKLLMGMPSMHASRIMTDRPTAKETAPRDDENFDRDHQFDFTCYKAENWPPSKAQCADHSTHRFKDGQADFRKCALEDLTWLIPPPYEHDKEPTIGQLDQPEGQPEESL